MERARTEHVMARDRRTAAESLRKGAVVTFEGRYGPALGDGRGLAPPSGGSSSLRVSAV